MLPHNLRQFRPAFIWGIREASHNTIAESRRKCGQKRLLLQFSNLCLKFSYSGIADFITSG